MTTHRKTIFAFSTLVLLFFLPVNLKAQSEEVTFWNKMESINGSQLISEVGPNLSLTGTSWDFRPSMFGDGWDNNAESSYAYANSTDLIEDIHEGTIAFWWVPDDDGDIVFQWPLGRSVFFSNGATNSPQNNTYGLEFWYARHASPASFFIWLYKQDSDGTNHRIFMHAGDHAQTGTWQAGDKVHVAFAWHNEPVILGQYIAVLWIDGVLAYGWTQPDTGTLEGWRTTNPVTPFSPTLRIGDSTYPYSLDEQLRGPIDNIVFWNYAKSDFSDRFIESPLALPPTANAGPNQSIHAGDTVILDGSGSYDDVTPSETLLYDWNFTDIPSGSMTTMTGSDTVNPTFIADLTGTYEVSLIVTDEDELTSEPSYVSISSLNTAPNADAGPDRASYVGNMLTLDGSGSNDPDNDPLNYAWSLLNSPAGSTAQLYDADSVMPTLLPDLPGNYDVELVVNDGLADSEPDTITLVIITSEDFAQQQIAETINVIAELPPTSVTTSGNQTALSNFLKQAINALQDNRIDKAESKLIMAIGRTDGCALRGSPDTHGGVADGILRDFISNCDDQALIYAQLLIALEALQ